MLTKHCDSFGFHFNGFKLLRELRFQVGELKADVTLATCSYCSCTVCIAIIKTKLCFISLHLQLYPAIRQLAT